MRLLCYIFAFKSIKKTELAIKQIYFTKKIRFLFLLCKFYIFSTSTWIIINSIQSLSFCSRIQSFLRKNFLMLIKIRNLNSRLHLLKIRMENSCSNMFLYGNWTIYTSLFKKLIYTPFNHLQVIPRFKNIVTNLSNLNSKFPFKKLYAEIFYKIKINFFKKKSTIFLNVDKSVYFLNKKIYEKKIKSFESIIIEKINLISESISIILSIVYLISYRRNFYSSSLLVSFIKTGFIKMNYFRDILIIRKKKKMTKIDPTINNFLRSGENKFFNFFKIAAVDFKILPSKNRIPIEFYVEFFENFELFKKQIKNVKILENVIANQVRFKYIRNVVRKKSCICNEKKFVNQKYNFPSSGKDIFFFQKKSWLEKKNILKKKIEYSLNDRWSVDRLIVKESKDFENEIIGTIFIAQIEKIFREEFLDLWLSSFFVYSVHSTSGLINIVPNSASLHELNKKKINSTNECQLKKKKQYKFTESLAAYSLFCFLFQLKDRHNGNILVNFDNRIVHIDFGYILGYMPGNLKFEADSFKLSKNFLLEIDGKNTEKYEYFRELFIRGFLVLKKNFGKIITVMKSFSFQHKFIFSNITYILKNFEKRLKLSVNDKNLIKFALNQIQESVESWKTLQYDKYQLHASGIN